MVVNRLHRTVARTPPVSDVIGTDLRLAKVVGKFCPNCAQRPTTLMSMSSSFVPAERIESLILFIRREKVMLDRAFRPTSCLNLRIERSRL